MTFPHPPTRPGSILRTSILLGLSVVGAACGGSVQGDPSARADYVPPILLTPPEDPVGEVVGADPGGMRMAARHLRSELDRFADTASPHARSYPAARCCPEVLRDLLVRGHRLDAGSAGGEGVVPILEELVNEPTLRRAPGLLDLVLERIPPAGADAPPS